MKKQLSFFIVFCIFLTCSAGASTFEDVEKAVKNGETEKVKSMLQASPKFATQRRKEGDSLLHLAAANGRNEIVELLLDKYGADINDRKNKYQATPLMLATNFKHFETSLLLIKRGADFKLRDAKGRSLIHLAAGKGSLKLVKYLLEKGVSVNDRTDKGFLPIHEAAGNGQLEICNFLIQKGSYIDPKSTEDNWTPLFVASLNGYIQCVEMLVREGANVNFQDKSGYSPLHAAAKYGHVDVVRLLINKGADVMAKTLEGETAATIAAREKHQKVADLIRNKSGEKLSVAESIDKKNTEEGSLQPSMVKFDINRDYPKLRKAVVLIYVEDARGRKGFGTGFIIESKNGQSFIATANHVAEYSERIKVITYDGRIIPASMYFGDRKYDVALLRVVIDGLPTIKVGNSDLIREGTEVATIGYPIPDKFVEKGLGVVPSLGKGNISAIRPYRGKELFQTDVSLNFGNSGGPLIRLDTGEAIGIVHAKFVGYEGLNMVMPMNILMNLLYKAKDKDGLALARRSRNQEMSLVYFYSYVARGDLKMAWFYLTESSRADITRLLVADINSRVRYGSGVTYSEVRKQLDQGTSKLSYYFWGSFSKVMQAPAVVNYGTFTTISSTATNATVLVKLKGGEIPYKLFYENGMWKIGFSETFNLKKYIRRTPSVSPYERY